MVFTDTILLEEQDVTLHLALDRERPEFLFVYSDIDRHVLFHKERARVKNMPPSHSGHWRSDTWFMCRHFASLRVGCLNCKSFLKKTNEF